MSLFRRLWLAVIGLTLAAFAGSLLVNTLTARSYLEKQLFLKNQDNATALALSMSQQADKDTVTMELLLSALFDNGHYQSIRLTDPVGQVIAERVAATDLDLGAPTWFVALLPIRAAPGVAHITDGWKQYGTIALASHGKFAYHDLWQGTLELIGWFFAGGIVAGLLGVLMLRLITRPLDQVVDQARAITERRFISIAEPDVPELKSVVAAMNIMVVRLKQMFAEEAARLDALRKRLNHDATSGLPNRDYFMARLREAAESDESAAHGVFLMMRLHNLAAINRSLGRVETDKLMRTIGDTLMTICGNHDKWLPARLNGPDFALLAQNQESVGALANPLAQALAALQTAHLPGCETLFHIGGMHYRRGDSVAQILAACDQLLAQAESRGPNAIVLHEGETGSVTALPAETWRQLIISAYDEKRLKLVDFPVVQADGAIEMHREAMLRLQTETGGPWRPAGDFMPFALRLRITPSLDRGTLNLALDALRGTAGDLAVNLTGDSFANPELRRQFVALIAQQGDLARRLWVEVPEQAVMEQFDAFRELCAALKNLGCKIGIENFGRKLDAVANLADLGVDYVKIDSSFVRDIDRNAGNREFLESLCKMVHAIGILIIAVGVQNAEELASLSAIGIDGATGPGVGKAG